MDFIDKIRALADTIPDKISYIETEEATKNAFIMPFINVLGYNVFDPTEVVPEYGADVGIKKGEKVDYAILRDGKPVILFECKSCTKKLDNEHMSQLYRYFTVTEARIAVLTNGIVYKFYSDLDEPNKMDDRPFLVIDLMNIQDALIPELKRLTRGAFDLEDIISNAGELKYTREIKRIFAKELVSPSDEFVKLFASRVYSGRFTKSVRDQFTDIFKRAFQQFINEKVNERLESALTRVEVRPAEEIEEEKEKEEVEEEVADNGVETTAEELEGFRVVQAILSEMVDPSVVNYVDRKTYFRIFLQLETKKATICRLHFNAARKKYIAIFEPDGEVEKLYIQSPEDIYKRADKLKEITSQHIAE